MCWGPSVPSIDCLTANNVAHDGAVQVGQDHDIELPRVGDQLHTAIVDDLKGRHYFHPYAK